MVKNLQTKYDLYGQTEFFLILVGLGGLLLFVYLTTPSGTFPSILNLNSKLKKKKILKLKKFKEKNLLVIYKSKKSTNPIIMKKLLSYLSKR